MNFVYIEIEFVYRIFEKRENTMLEKRVDKDQIWNRDYIYLDWNVIKYLKEPRENKEKIDGDAYQIILKLVSRYIYRSLNIAVIVCFSHISLKDTLTHGTL